MTFPLCRITLLPPGLQGNRSPLPRLPPALLRGAMAHSALWLVFGILVGDQPAALQKLRPAREGAASLCTGSKCRWRTRSLSGPALGQHSPQHHLSSPVSQLLLPILRLRKLRHRQEVTRPRRGRSQKLARTPPGVPHLPPHATRRAPLQRPRGFISDLSVALSGLTWAFSNSSSHPAPPPANTAG